MDLTFGSAIAFHEREGITMNKLFEYFPGAKLGIAPVRRIRVRRLSTFLLCAASTLGLTAAYLTAAAPQATVDLGQAGHFAVLAGSTVTNVISAGTVINGDLGVSAGTAVTGFFPVDGGPGVVKGTIYTPTTICQKNKACVTQDNDIAALGQSSLTVAYNDAAGRDVDPVNVDGADLGGSTLTPGLYKSATTLAITGDLTLAGNGVYIFQMGTGLTVNSNARVVLTSGATAAKIFWQVGTSAALGTYSVFKGTIMADQSITIATGATLEGRALARIASVTLDSNVVTIPTIQKAGGGGGGGKGK